MPYPPGGSKPLGGFLLFKEPEMLFFDEMRTSVLAFSILTLIGLGCNRLSEIAGRLEKPATQLNRPIKLLIDLGYVRRETPFSTSLKSTKKSLYKISDPFMNFYFSFVVPNKSRLEFGLIEQVWDEINGKFNQYVSEIWEELCRNAVPRLKIEGKTFNPAQRWWGNGTDGKAMEIDIVAESTDKSTLLIGEVKWIDNIATPCSVKTNGGFLKPIFSLLDITICDFHSCISSLVIWNIKSSGKRFSLRLTA